MTNKTNKWPPLPGGQSAHHGRGGISMEAGGAKNPRGRTGGLWTNGKIRIGTVNVGTLRGREAELVDMAGRRSLDFCCLQETRWRGGSTRVLGGEDRSYKLFWKGCKEGVVG